MAILGFVAFRIGAYVRTWRRAFVGVAVLAVLFLAWNVVVLVGVVVSMPVPDPVGGLAQAGGYLGARVVIGAVMFLITALLGQGIRMVMSGRQV